MSYRVAVIGAGPGVGALHLPSMRRPAAGFVPVAFADGGSGRGARLARRHDAAYDDDVVRMLADAAADVALICSPPTLHATHVRAAIEAGVRGILCEKPLALTAEDVTELVAAARERGVALMVGTNHLFDPAWERTKHHLVAAGGDVVGVAATLSLAPNDRYHRQVTEIDPADLTPPRAAPGELPPQMRADIVWQLLTGLGIHDLPAVRDLLPTIDEIEFARFVAPIGYVVGYRSGGVPVQLSAVMRGPGAETRWRLTVHTTHDTVDVEFPPPFVHAGSASVRVRAADGRETRYARVGEDGYDREWRTLAAMLGGELAVEYEELAADARYVIELADRAAAWIREDAS